MNPTTNENTIELNLLKNRKKLNQISQNNQKYTQNFSSKIKKDKTLRLKKLQIQDTILRNKEKLFKVRKISKEKINERFNKIRKKINKIDKFLVIIDILIVSFISFSFLSLFLN